MIFQLCLVACLTCLKSVMTEEISDLFTYQHSQSLIQTSTTINVIYNTTKTTCFYTCFTKKECCASSFDDISGTCLIDRSPQWTIPSDGYLYTKSVSDIVLGQPRDCSGLPSGSFSGKYTIYPDGINGVDVYCDMTTDGGNWTVFQKVKNRDVNFYLYWTDYRDGFGDPNGDFWLGNKYVHELTSHATYQLRIDFWDWHEVHRYAKFGIFSISDEADKYRLNVGNFIGGGAGDGLKRHSGNRFSTRDNDNDELCCWNCAWGTNGGGFWYTNCHKVDMNGSRDYDGYGVKRSLMMIRKT